MVRTGERKNKCEILKGITERYRIPRRPRYGWKDNVKMHLKEK